MKSKITFNKVQYDESLGSWSSRELDIVHHNTGMGTYAGGPYATMYVAQPWTIRQYAGFSTAEDSNQFYRHNLAAGQKGLSVAFDLATHRGYDSDHPRVVGDVGKAGVAIDSVEDMKILFDNIPLDQISVSMTMNGAVIPILAYYIVAAEEQGVSVERLTGTIQNDILKEFLVRNTYIYPPTPSMRLVTDILKYTAAHMPRFNPISISGYHMLEAGAPPHVELAFTLADGYEYLEYGKKAGLSLNDFVPRFSFFFGIGMDVFLEIAKLRAARILWSELVIKAGATKDRAKLMRTHCQTSGWSLTQQDIANNITRTALEALAAVWGGTQSLHTNSMDEAVSLPTPTTAAIARNTQLFLQQSTGICQWIDVMGGSKILDVKVNEIVQQAQSIIDEVFTLGGMTQAILSGYPKKIIEEAAATKQAKIDGSEEFIIGLNLFREEESQSVESLRINHHKVFTAQSKRLSEIKKNRDQSKVIKSLRHITKTCRSEKYNILEAAISAARHRATLGEISSAIEKAFGRYQAPISGLSKVYAVHSMKNKYFKTATQLAAVFDSKYGRRPRILIAKLGQDGHDRGAKIIAAGFADIGFDVDMGPLFQTPSEAAKHAIENDVHFIGVSTLAGAHLTLIPELIRQLRSASRADIHVLAGGIIPAHDFKSLFDSGVLAIFGPGTNLAEAATKILKLMV